MRLTSTQQSPGVDAYYDRLRRECEKMDDDAEVDRKVAELVAREREYGIEFWREYKRRHVRETYPMPISSSLARLHQIPEMLRKLGKEDELGDEALFDIISGLERRQRALIRSDNHPTPRYYAGSGPFRHEVPPPTAHDARTDAEKHAHWRVTRLYGRYDPPGPVTWATRKVKQVYGYRYICCWQESDREGGATHMGTEYWFGPFPSDVEANIVAALDDPPRVWYVGFNQV